MTNRVIPAQGEERGTSLTLAGLDGDARAKFQPHAGKNHFASGLAARLQRNVNKCLKSRKNPVKTLKPTAYLPSGQFSGIVYATARSGPR
jgi:hypothetical protein